MVRRGSVGGLLRWLLWRIDAEAVRARFSRRLPTRLIGGFLIVMGLLGSVYLRGIGPPAAERATGLDLALSLEGLR